MVFFEWNQTRNCKPPHHLCHRKTQHPFHRTKPNRLRNSNKFLRCTIGTTLATLPVEPSSFYYVAWVIMLISNKWTKCSRPWTMMGTGLLISNNFCYICWKKSTSNPWQKTSFKFSRFLTWTNQATLRRLSSRWSLKATWKKNTLTSFWKLQTSMDKVKSTTKSLSRPFLSDIPVFILLSFILLNLIRVLTSLLKVF